MIKIKDLQYRSFWYKKNYYYLKSGQSLSASTKIAAGCLESMQIHQEIDEGLRLSDILSGPDFQPHFSNTEISFIKVAERTGNIDKVFLSLSDLLKDRHQQRQKLATAFVYPILVLCITFGLLLMILLVIIPKISPLFKDLKQVPITTSIIMHLSGHLIGYWYMDLLTVFIIATALIFLRRNQTLLVFKNKAQNFFLSKTPYIKEIYFNWHTETWLKVIYMSMDSGVPISQALLFAHESVSDTKLKKQFERIYEAVQKGNTCAGALKLLEAPVYKKIHDWESVIDSGERTGKFKEVFEICHANIKEGLFIAFDRFQRMIEPLLIIIVGTIVLIICISIIVPMYQLTQSLQ